MRLPTVLSVCTKTAWSPSARAVAAGLDTLAKAGVAAIAAAAAVVAAAMAAAAVTRIAVLTKTPQKRGDSVFWPPSVPLEEFALQRPGGRVRLGGPAEGAVTAGRDAAVPREGAAERVLGGVAERSGDGADGVVGVAQA